MVLPFGEGVTGKSLGNIRQMHVHTYMYILRDSVGGGVCVCGSPCTDMHICVETLCAALGYSVADFLN